MTLPKDLEKLILDYYWSHKTYCIKSRVLDELRRHHLRRQTYLCLYVFPPYYL